jgi:hypothetical protein
VVEIKEFLNHRDTEAQRRKEEKAIEREKEKITKHV